MAFVRATFLSGHPNAERQRGLPNSAPPRGCLEGQRSALCVAACQVEVAEGDAGTESAEAGLIFSNKNEPMASQTLKLQKPAICLVV